MPGSFGTDRLFYIKFGLCVVEESFDIADMAQPYYNCCDDAEDFHSQCLIWENR